MSPCRHDFIRCLENSFGHFGGVPSMLVIDRWDRGQKQEAQIQVQRTFGRRTGELNGSLSGSARFSLLLTHYGNRWIFATTGTHCLHG